MLPDAMGYAVGTIGQVIAGLETALHAPPPYGRHTLDRLHLCRSIMGSQSAANTPVYRPATDGTTGPGGISAVELSRRLHGLQHSRRTMSGLPQDLWGDPQFRNDGSCAGLDNGSSGRPTVDKNHNGSSQTLPDPTTSNAQYYDLDDLSRVPSYSTAIRSGVPTTSSPATLPNYDSAI